MTSPSSVLPARTAARSGADQERFAHIVRLAQHVFDVPMVAVTLVDDRRQTMLAHVGMDGADVPRPDSICAHVVDGDEAMVVPDATRDARLVHNPFVTADPHVRFYAGEPLRGRTGAPVGTLCLLDSTPRDLSDHESRMLRDLADWVERELVHDDEAEQARRIQRRILPLRELDVPGWDIAGGCRPALDAGGDYYDWLSLPDGRVQVVLADVMGKGMEGAVVASGVRAVLRGASRHITLPRTVQRIDEFLQDDESGTFVTFFGLRVDPVTGHSEWLDAGHGLALVVDGGGSVRRLAAAHPPLGVVPALEWTTVADRVEVGETLVVFSDGVLDAFDDLGSAVEEVALRCADAATAHAAVAAVTAAGGRSPQDDVTVVALRRTA